jgi:excinuclease UvrABC nuclease subunit
VYRLRNPDGDLLYIGCSGILMRRMEQHSVESGWWSQVATIEVEHHPTRTAALMAETAAIASESPLYNKNHNSSSEHLVVR